MGVEVSEGLNPGPSNGFGVRRCCVISLYGLLRLNLRHVCCSGFDGGKLPRIGDWLLRLLRVGNHIGHFDFNLSQARIEVSDSSANDDDQSHEDHHKSDAPSAADANQLTDGGGQQAALAQHWRENAIG